MKKTLRKTDKLKLKSDFDYVRENGTKLVSPGMLVVIAPAPAEGGLRCGVICSRKYSLLAVKRNRARRILWESFRLMKREIGRCNLVLIPRRGMMDYSQGEAMKELRRLLKKGGMLMENPEVGSGGSPSKD